MARRCHRRFVRLVDRLEDESVSEAVATIVSGRVTVNGLVVTNPDALVAADAVVALLPVRVLRGTVKLRAALARFGVRVSGRVCLDVGAAAGGFTAGTDYLSRAYAAKVGLGLQVSTQAVYFTADNGRSATTTIPLCEEAMAQ
jgi:23S rRNA (cytidine1920-2'-O)/16S rRNA (cytidine1409-2'-O)-methyltransferase